MAKMMIVCIGSVTERMLFTDGMDALLTRNGVRANLMGFESAEDAIAYMEDAGMPDLVVAQAHPDASDSTTALVRFLTDRAGLRTLIVHSTDFSDDLTSLADGETLVVIDPSDKRERLCRAAFDALSPPT